MERRTQGKMQSLPAALPRAELYSDSLFRENDAAVQSNHTEMRDYAILPRRKAGQSVAVGERAPVLLTKSVLSNYFGMPLSAAAKELVRRNAIFFENIADCLCFRLVGCRVSAQQPSRRSAGKCIPILNDA